MMFNYLNNTLVCNLNMLSTLIKSVYESTIHLLILAALTLVQEPAAMKPV